MNDDQLLRERDHQIYILRNTLADLSAAAIVFRNHWINRKSGIGIMSEYLQEQLEIVEALLQDQSRCNEKLRDHGAAYPRTCAICGLGPCQRVNP
jgi:hypothetical protein